MADALDQLREPPLLSEGMAALVRLAGRSRKHIARQVQKHCQRSPSELITALRMTWAEHQLAFSDRSMQEIARACGIGRARLHRLFLERYGCAPRAYRQRCRGAMG